MLGTKFNYYDLSAIPEIVSVPDVDTSPVVLSAAATEKGTEDIFEGHYDDFIAMFGQASFKKYGQISIQNQRMLANGAKIVFQRLVADDATLANIGIVAKLYQTQAQKVNVNGESLFYDDQMNETTEDTGNPVTMYTAHVRYEAVTIPDVKTYADVEAEFAKLLDETGTTETLEDGATQVTVFTYPFFAVSDNGRGNSAKRFYITRESSLSKNLKFMFYTLNILEDGKVSDAQRFSIVPSTAYYGKCVDLDSAGRALVQAKTGQIEDMYEKFLNKLSELSGVEAVTLAQNDLIFGTTRKGIAFEGIQIDTVNGIDLTLETGIGLMSGSTGSLTDAPEQNANELYYDLMYKFYAGKITHEIYNLDMYQLDLCFDANFPLDVKNAITDLANYRKDFTYFRDMGLEIYQLEDVRAMLDNFTKSTYATDFCQAYTVLDPYSYKQIVVTIMFSVAAIIVKHIETRRHQPFAGKRFNAVIPDVLEKSAVRFAPKVIPDYDEKAEMEDMRVNFASYFKDDFVIESLYTSQDEYTQLSFSNNVMAVQQVVKGLRVKFPAIRYQFITKPEDLEVYEAEVNEELSKYRANFAELRYQYIEDKTYVANKIYRAALYFRFNDFVQAEIIDAYMLPTEI